MIQDREGRERERYNVVYGAVLRSRRRESSSPARSWPSGIPTTSPILTDVPGTIKFKDIEAGVTMKEEVEEVSGLAAGDRAVPGREEAPAVLVQDKKGKTQRKILLPVHAT